MGISKPSKQKSPNLKSANLWKKSKKLISLFGKAKHTGKRKYNSRQKLPVPWLQKTHGKILNSRASILMPKGLKSRLETFMCSWRLDNNSRKFWQKWGSKKCRPIVMFSLLSGTLMLSSSLKPTLPETPTTLSSFPIQRSLKLRMNNTKRK